MVVLGGGSPGPAIPGPSLDQKLRIKLGSSRANHVHTPAPKASKALASSRTLLPPALPPSLQRRPPAPLATSLVDSGLPPAPSLQRRPPAPKNPKSPSPREANSSLQRRPSRDLERSAASLPLPPHRLRPPSNALQRRLQCRPPAPSSSAGGAALL
ncbi:serine/arginine repetitive matrix protein 1-like [Zingiber officinale]|uniref:serine/arginine repetitive matrix protein 1-like n=1 Tax=Zingiber officinale TaxID=94328 RepID=UPI001C4D832F|nr:serine/arginine repetitive matrix protein 1-like [Zingiber officinale]